MEGWVKIHRKLTQWQWATSPRHLALFITILLRANYKPTKWRKVNLEAGQLLTGRKQLSLWTGIPESTIYRILNDLEDSGEVNIKKRSKYSIITVTNWSKYQESEQQNGSKMNNKWTSNEHQMDTSKKEKKYKKEKNTQERVGVSADALNHENIIRLYNKHATQSKKYNMLFLSPNATQKFKEAQGFKPFDSLEGWERLFKKAFESEWALTKSFVNLIWLLDVNNASKVLAGTYGGDSKPSGPSLAEQAKELEAELKAKGEW